MSKETVMEQQTTEWKAGYDCAINGANTTNCRFSFFSTKEKADQWTKGKSFGDLEKRSNLREKVKVKSKEPIRICRVCGCSDQDGCYHPKYGNCWWADATICSHCQQCPGEAIRWSRLP